MNSQSLLLAQLIRLRSLFESQVNLYNRKLILYSLLECEQNIKRGPYFYKILQKLKTQMSCYCFKAIPRSDNTHLRGKDQCTTCLKIYTCRLKLIHYIIRTTYFLL